MVAELMIDTNQLSFQIMSERTGLLGNQEELLRLMSRLLEGLLGETRGVARAGSAFDCKQIPGVSVLSYLQRMGRYAQCSPCVFVGALIYMDRYQERIQHFIINYYNIHRLLISTLMLAAKYYDDFYYKNEFYAKIGGISHALINQLETDLVDTLDFAFFITEEEFNSYLERIEHLKDVDP